jgi:hypothetical protein
MLWIRFIHYSMNLESNSLLVFETGWSIFQYCVILRGSVTPINCLLEINKTSREHRLAETQNKQKQMTS